MRNIAQSSRIKALKEQSKETDFWPGPHIHLSYAEVEKSFNTLYRTRLSFSLPLGIPQGRQISETLNLWLFERRVHTMYLVRTIQKESILIPGIMKDFTTYVHGLFVKLCFAGELLVPKWKPMPVTSLCDNQSSTVGDVLGCFKSELSLKITVRYLDRPFD